MQFNELGTSENPQKIIKTFPTLRTVEDADWLIGMNGSRVAEVFLPKKRTERISLGRVQTATLAIIVDHEIDILQHSNTILGIVCRI